jgi:hypothetical protein
MKHPFRRPFILVVRPMSQNLEKLEQQAERATTLLRDRVVENVWRHKEGELVIQFRGGTRLFVDASNSSIELSITGDTD